MGLSIYSEYGRTVGAFHGIQCGFHHRIALLYDIPAVLCPAALRRRRTLPSNRAVRRRNGVEKVKEAIVRRLRQTNCWQNPCESRVDLACER